jgi:hypothetical protein
MYNDFSIRNVDIIATMTSSSSSSCCYDYMFISNLNIKHINQQEFIFLEILNYMLRVSITEYTIFNFNMVSLCMRV